MATFNVSAWFYVDIDVPFEEGTDEYEEAIEILEQAVKTAIRFDINSGGQVQIALQTKAGKNHIAFLD